jgi:hypothetical protein
LHDEPTRHRKIVVAVLSLAGTDREISEKGAAGRDPDTAWKAFGA